MGNNAALFLFLAAAAVGAFTFVSIVVWVTARTSERKARDRFALLKALAEGPNENAERVLAYLREDEQARLGRREEEERKGYRVGGVLCMAIGVGLRFVLPMYIGPSVLVFLIGVAMLPFGFNWKRRGPAGAGQ